MTSLVPGPWFSAIRFCHPALSFKRRIPSFMRPKDRLCPDAALLSWLPTLPLINGLQAGPQGGVRPSAVRELLSFITLGRSCLAERHHAKRPGRDHLQEAIAIVDGL